MAIASWCSVCFVLFCVFVFCTGRFVMVPLNLTCLHCLQHSFFEHHFNLYFILTPYQCKNIIACPAITGCEIQRLVLNLQRHHQPSAHQSTGVWPLISVHPRDGGAAAWIKHC